MIPLIVKLKVLALTVIIGLTGCADMAAPADEGTAGVAEGADGEPSIEPSAAPSPTEQIAKRVDVPSMELDSLRQAKRVAERLGIRLKIRWVVEELLDEGTILDQSKWGKVKPGAAILLTVARTPDCTPGYSPCLPPASDYDCLGGIGNGPEYTGFVRVSGSDPYDLDADGDGDGCES